jgi:hypothetical protein
MKNSSLKTNDNTPQNIYKQKQLDDEDILQVLAFLGLKLNFKNLKLIF